MLSDRELLQRYHQTRAEEVFSELVDRHVGLVYSTALRIVQQPELAQEVVQQVFLTLAKNSGKLVKHPAFLGWLHRTTHHLSCNVVRTEQRRRLREQEAQAMNHFSPEPEWNEIAEHLESAMAKLKDSDRQILILRYFQNKTAAEIGLLLGTSEPAAQKRAVRALQTLRTLLFETQVKVGLTTLSSLLTANAISAVPAGLAAKLTGAVTTLGATSAGVSAGPFWITAAHKVTAGVAVSAVVAVASYHLSKQSERDHQVQQFTSQRAQLEQRIETLSQTISEHHRQADSLQKIAGRLRDEADEATRLRAQLKAGEQPQDQIGGQAELPSQQIERWLRRAKELKELPAIYPEYAIPELGLLQEQDWLTLARRSLKENPGGEMELGDRSAARAALKNARATAKDLLSGPLIRALEKYVNTNGGVVPTSTEDLWPSIIQQSENTHDARITARLSPEMLKRYDIVYRGNWAELEPGSGMIIVESTPTDPQHETRLVIRKNVSELVEPGSPSYWPAAATASAESTH